LSCANAETEIKSIRIIVTVFFILSIFKQTKIHTKIIPKKVQFHNYQKLVLRKNQF